MTNKISMDKKYRTRSGIAIRRILCVDRGGSVYPVVAETEGGTILFSTEHGYQGSAGDTSSYDLIEVSPYEDFKIDDKVMVSNNETFWVRAHFAGVNSEGLPTAFKRGATSWSSLHLSVPESWKNCRKPTAEELAK